MDPTRPLLTPAIEQTIAAYIRAGGFPHVAAEAAGIPREVFDRWLRRGQGPRAPRVYRQFRAAVCQAVAQARLAAEVAAFQKRPLDWLKSGPGKETADRPGWTTTVKPQPPAADQAPPDFLHPQVQALCRALLEVLAPYPEARAAVAAALAGPGGAG